MSKIACLYEAVHPAAVNLVSAIVMEVAAAVGQVAGVDKTMKIELALEEALVNISSYAYGNVEEIEKPVAVKAWRESAVLIIRLVDHGIAYNPLQAAEPESPSDIEECKLGGFGIHFMKKVMDEVRYERRDGTNILTFIMNLDVKEERINGDK